MPTVNPPGCRFCGTTLEHVFADLGETPLANSYLEPHQLEDPEPVFPLKVMICGECLLVQLPELESAEAIFNDYAYFSSYSDSWLAHAKVYCDLVVDRFALDGKSQVVEVASNDGYLLKNFVARGIPVLGIEPAANVAKAAEAAGVTTRVEFFGRDTAAALATEGIRADLLLGNNVVAHVPDLMDFIAGIPLVLKPAGVMTLEFPHLLRLMDGNQFDTIYHEHFSYFSFKTARAVLAANALEVFDVQEIPTHGGSLRIFAQHRDSGVHETAPAVEDLAARERSAGMSSLETYLDFDRSARQTRDGLLEFLRERKRQGKSVAAYGAPAKGNTLLNYCGIGSETIDFTVDRSPHKQGRFLPGSRIPIHPPEKLFERRPDTVLILPWNLVQEIAQALAGVADWGGELFVAIPEVQRVPAGG